MCVWGGGGGGVERANDREMYLQWSLCQVRVTVGDSGLCCCTCVKYFEC